MSGRESRRRDVLKAGALGAAAGLIAGVPGRSAAARAGPTTYSISPTNFMIVDEQVRQSLELVVGGQPGAFANGIVLKPKNLAGGFQPYVQIGLTLPVGRITSLSLDYSCGGASFITQINLIEVNAAGASRVIWTSQGKQVGMGRYAPAVNQNFTGSLDLTVGVVFQNLNERILIGTLTVSVG